MRILLITLALAGCSPSDAPEGGSAGVSNLYDLDGDGFGGDADCDDTDPTAHPGADEVCDGRDNDCDGEVDEEPTDGRTWYADEDGDGYGDDETATVSCLAPEGAVTQGGDCDDSDAAFHPGATEDDCADPSDYNCDGSTGFVDEDGDGVAACEDCDDTDPAVHPGAEEVCDGVDNDCDGTVDGAEARDALVWFADGDGDGWGNPAVSVHACEAPEGMVGRAGDCDDEEASAHPDAAEVCDEADIDEDCDGVADGPDAEGQTTWYPDDDGDGYGRSDAGVLACDAPTGMVALADDCDDDDASVNPGATERCDGQDDDCDGWADDDDPDIPSTSLDTWFRDLDGDGYGTDFITVTRCAAPSGYVDNDVDCDDTDAAVNPGATEICDGQDDDCDEAVDDDDPDVDVSTQGTWYLDDDGDGFGGAMVSACTQPSGTIDDGSDCDDTDASVNPDAVEVCDGQDDDCDGLTDDDDPGVDSATFSTFYTDADGDGHGDADSPVMACALPVGAASVGDDCDDTSAARSPDADEICDETDTDEDCDGLADDDDPDVDTTTFSTFYEDGDGDGWGTGASTTSACDAPAGYAEDAGDCDDADAEVNPGAVEVCDADDVDEDCDGLSDDDDPSVDLSDGTLYQADVDGDGYGDPDSAALRCDLGSGWTTDDTDCDDTDASVNPGVAQEDCATVADDNCDGDTNDEDAAGCADWFLDADGDGYGDTLSACYCEPQGAWSAATGTDCDDAESAVNPGATETCDGLDDDCDGDVDDGLPLYYADADGDGFGDASDAGTCDEDAGVSDATDCDDADADVNPDAAEVCDEIDNDCDGDIDDDDPDAVLSTWYVDADLDGYGDEASSTESCAEPSGYVDDATDCDDSDADVNPGASERYGDTTDDDCDGATRPTYDCTGTAVPSDYATLAAAVSALQDSGTLETICLAAGSYAGTTIGGDVEIIGVSAEDTFISGLVTIEAAGSSSHAPTTIMQGLTLEDGVAVEDTGYQTTHAWLLNVVVENSAGHAVEINRDGYGDPNVFLEGVDASSSGGDAVHISDRGTVADDPLVVEIQSSWLHDSDYGVYASTSSSKYPNTEIALRNNTITDNQDGVKLSDTKGDSTWEIVNNAITGSSVVGLSWSEGRATDVSSATNLLYDNGTAYDGDAVAADDDLADDPLWDTTYEPPLPGSASPLSEAATVEADVSEDFWGVTRASAPSIGAVEP